MTRNTPEVRTELYLLLNAASGILGQNRSFFEGEKHTKIFLEAYMDFCRKTLQIHDVTGAMGIQERQAIVDSTRGKIQLDVNTWTISEPK